MIDLICHDTSWSFMISHHPDELILTPTDNCEAGGRVARKSEEWTRHSRHLPCDASMRLQWSQNPQRKNTLGFAPKKCFNIYPHLVYLVIYLFLKTSNIGFSWCVLILPHFPSKNDGIFHPVSPKWSNPQHMTWPPSADWPSTPANSGPWEFHGFNGSMAGNHLGINYKIFHSPEISEIVGP